jgi:hypothetical protein
MGDVPHFAPVGGLRRLPNRVLRPPRVIIRVTLPLPFELPAEPVSSGPAVRMPVAPAAAVARRDRAKGAWVLDVELDLPRLDPEHLLAESEGYLVDRLDGGELGVVNGLETDEGTGRVSALLVAGGWFGRRRFRVDADAIDLLLPADRRVVVRETGVRRLDGDGSV